MGFFSLRPISDRGGRLAISRVSGVVLPLSLLECRKSAARNMQLHMSCVLALRPKRNKDRASQAMKTLFKYMAMATLLMAGQTFANAQTDEPDTDDPVEPPSVNQTDPPSTVDQVVPGDRTAPSEQGSELTDDVDDTAEEAEERSSGIFPEDDSPWFDNDDLRRELDLDEDQIRRLNDAYGAAWRQMRSEGENAGNAGAGLSDEARARRMRELRDRFEDTFSRDTRSIFRDERQRQRFNQLSLQRQGFSAFDNPRLQRDLNLNETQIRQLQDLNQSFNSELESLRGTFAADRQGTERRFNELRDRTETGFQGILNDQQRTAFDEMTGERFDFGNDIFFVEPLQRNSSNAQGSGPLNQSNNRTGLGTSTGVGTQGGTGLGTQGGTGAGTQGGTGTGTGGGTGGGTSGGTGGGTGGTGS
jgi:hypothetical protein